MSLEIALSITAMLLAGVVIPISISVMAAGQRAQQAALANLQGQIDDIRMRIARLEDRFIRHEGQERNEWPNH